MNGLSDLTVPASEFSLLNLDVQRVFVTENEINGLAFPAVADSVVVFGLGYGLELLMRSEWLTARRLFYWGDIDTHGFAMLDRLRGAFPEARSFLMDRETLVAHRPLWVREWERYAKRLERLNDAEQALFDDLQHDRFGDGVRLERERISFGWVEGTLSKLVGS